MLHPKPKLTQLHPEALKPQPQPEPRILTQEPRSLNPLPPTSDQVERLTTAHERSIWLHRVDKFEGAFGLEGLNYLARSVNKRVLESQVPNEIVNLLLDILTIVKLTIWGGGLIPETL